MTKLPDIHSKKQKKGEHANDDGVNRLVLASSSSLPELFYKINEKACRCISEVNTS